MVDVKHSECFTLNTMLWNLHNDILYMYMYNIMYMHSAVRSRLEGVRVDVSCTCAVCIDIIAYTYIVCGGFLTRAEVYRWYTIASVVYTR